MGSWERWLRPPQSPPPLEPSEPEAPHRPSFVARTAGKAGWLLALAVVGMFVLALALRLILTLSGWLPLIAVVIVAVVVAKRRGTDAVVGQAKRAGEEAVRYFRRRGQQ